MRRISAKRVIWGMPGPRDFIEFPRAEFSHAVLRDADLTEARICGFFYGTKLVGASLVQADLSHSNFLGPKHYEMSFSGAQLIGAKLRHCQISSVSFFNADCSETDFSYTVLSDVRMKGCNLIGAIFTRLNLSVQSSRPITCLTQSFDEQSSGHVLSNLARSTTSDLDSGFGNTAISSCR
jgi:hypothetical protein